jgi:hypothetical protein
MQLLEPLSAHFAYPILPRSAVQFLQQLLGMTLYFFTKIQSAMVIGRTFSHGFIVPLETGQIHQG